VPALTLGPAITALAPLIACLVGQVAPGSPSVRVALPVVSSGRLESALKIADVAKDGSWVTGNLRFTGRGVRGWSGGGRDLVNC
jgi:hypothetical protein